MTRDFAFEGCLATPCFLITYNLSWFIGCPPDDEAKRNEVSAGRLIYIAVIAYAANAMLGPDTKNSLLNEYSGGFRTNMRKSTYPFGGISCNDHRDIEDHT